MMFEKITIPKADGNFVDYKKIHDQSFINVDEILKPQPVAISIGKSVYKGSDYPIAYGSYGDFSCIVGASKSKKTFLKSMLTASYIGGRSNLYAPEITGHESKNKFVIDIDTEQSEYHSQRVFRRVTEMVGANPSFYKPFSLRKLSPDERLSFIDWIFTESPYIGQIGLVCIDGIADLVNDVNDLEKSNYVTQKLLEWSHNQKCHIITVLHRNFGVKKPTGHLGSSVLKKAETVVFVESQKHGTEVTPEYTRNQPFEPFAFDIDNNWLPHVITDNDIGSEMNDIILKKGNASF